MSIPVDVEKCAARPIDIRQAATPDGLLADLRERLRVLEEGVLRLQALAEGAAAMPEARARARAAVAAAGGVGGGPQIRVAVAVAAPGAPGGVA